jgi:hypothetical protein
MYYYAAWHFLVYRVYFIDNIIGRTNRSYDRHDRLYKTDEQCNVCIGVISALDLRQGSNVPNLFVLRRNILYNVFDTYPNKPKPTHAKRCI